MEVSIRRGSTLFQEKLVRELKRHNFVGAVSLGLADSYR